ncbi:MAG: protein kinase family protein [Clostridium sp.]|nr:protein kinase family protein [Clostridium sp.]
MLLNILKKDIKYRVDDVLDNYIIRKQLGEGRYGITYLAENKNGELFTVKQLKKSMLSKTLEKVKYESMILEELGDVKSSFFPKYISNFKDKYREGYILEYIDGKTFEEILYEDKVVFEKEKIYKIALELIEMIKILESKNIVHKDIRVTNVIYTKDESLKLIDFGLARYVDNKNYKRDLDYWYISDFLIHLHYSIFNTKRDLFQKKKAWYDELDLLPKEKEVLMSMMGIGNKKYNDISEIEIDIKEIMLAI